MATKGTEFTSEAKSEFNAQVASEAKCPVDHGSIAASPVSKPSGRRVPIVTGGQTISGWSCSTRTPNFLTPWAQSSTMQRSSRLSTTKA